MPARNTLRQPYPHTQDINEARQTLVQVLRSVDEVTVKADDRIGGKGLLIHALRNTWSRAARRKKVTEATPSADPQARTPALVCYIQCLQETQNARDGRGRRDVVLEFNWVHGKDRGLFESFMSHVARKMDMLVRSPDVEMH